MNLSPSDQIGLEMTLLRMIAFHPDYENSEKKNLNPTSSQNTKNKDYGTYEGEMINGKPHGQATQTWYNGEKYEGEWSKGIPNGQGTRIYSDGEKFVGELQFAVHWNGTYYDKDGNIIAKYVNGKLIKQ